MPLFPEGKPLRTVLRWQLLATAASMLLAGFLMGRHGAASAFFGGIINFTAGAVSGWLATRRTKKTAGEALYVLIRAEAVKVALIVAQLWLVLVSYGELVAGAFFGTFVVTVIFYSMAIFVRDRPRERR